MRKATARTWSFFGIALLLVATLVMGWFVGRFIPGTPRASLGDRETGKYPGIAYTGVYAERDVDIDFGDSLLLEGVTQGLKFDAIDTPSYRESLMESGLSEDEAAALEEEHQKLLEESELYAVEYGTFEFSVSDTKVVSDDAFREWYPDFSIPAKSSIPQYQGSPLPAKVFLVTVNVTNSSETESLMLPDVLLWSDELNQPDNTMGLGASPERDIIRIINPDQELDWYINQEWKTLSPGESKELVIPYYLFKNSFKNDEDFDELDLSKFCLEVNDFDPGIRYRFWLA